MQEVLIITILVLVVAYIAFVVLFPKAIPQDSSQHAKDFLNDIYDQARQQNDEDESHVILKDPMQGENSLIQGLFAMPVLKTLYPIMLQAGEGKNSVTIAMILVGGMLGLTFLLLLANVGVLALLLGPVLAFLIVHTYLKRKIRKRNEKFINGFADVLDMFVRSLKSGFPVTAAFRMVAENTESPIKEEFQQIVSELAIGQSVNQALARLGQRINEADIHFFIVVMKVQQETGGNMAEVVSNLSNVIRKRKQLRLKIKAMTSEGRATGAILGGLPLVVMVALYFASPDYIEVMWTTNSGMVALGFAAALVAGAMIVVNKMIQLDI